jgi:hypothetical protein
LFFQLALVVGYGYAHWSRRLGPGRQAIVHLGLLVLGVLALPITASAVWKPEGSEDPALAVLALLAATVGGPYVLLSATAPLLQDWYARVAPGRSPYRLYVLSNTASLLALLSYPLLVERFLPVSAQSAAWSAVFVGFAIACAACAWTILKRVPARPEADIGSAPAGSPPPVLDRVLWILLPATASGLLLAVTNQLCQDVAVVPLLWVVPLALYLVTFIVSFADLYRRRVWVVVFVASLFATGYALANASTAPLVFQGGALLTLLTSGCLVCHGELVHLRPRVAHLTAFYLALSIGGSLGGLFVALVAPLLFENYAELPFLMMTVPALLTAVVFRDATARKGAPVPVVVWVLPMVVVCVSMVVVLRGSGRPADTIASGRNFYGILRIAEGRIDGTDSMRGLFHGRVLHGAQFVDDARRRVPTTYFGTGSGAAIAIAGHSRRQRGDGLRVGIVGLGAGTIAAWGQAGDHLRFFELNPQVVEFARRYFTFLADSAAAIDVVTGDARLSLEREMADPANHGTYDVIVVDAFSGDSIPTHLLTRECFSLYQQALDADGILAFHISNQFLDLEPVVSGLAADPMLHVLRTETPTDPATAARTSYWLLVTANEAFVSALPAAVTAAPRTPAIVWTDTFSSLVSVLR